MAKHEITIRENTGTTKTEAPYLANYLKKSDLSFSSACTQIAAEAGLTETQIRAIIEGSFAEFAKLETDGAVRLHVDGFTIGVAIYGSFASSDAAFDATKNTLALAIYLDDDIRYVLANVTPTIVTDETSTKVRITGVADIETPRPYEVIYGTRPYEIQGYNLVSTDEGFEAYLEGSDGTKYPNVIDEAPSKQLLKVHTASLLEPGDYKQFVKSRGGDPDGTLQSDFRKVKYLKIARPPTITKAYPSDDPTLLDNLVNDGNNVIEGTHLLNAKIYVDSVSEENELALVETATDTKLVFEGCGKTAGTSFTLIVKNDEGQVERTVTAVNPPTQPTLTKVYAESNPTAENHIQCFEEINDLIGTDLTSVTEIKYTWMSGGEEPVPMSENGEITSKTATLLKFKMPEVQFGTSGNLVVTWSGGEVTLSGVTADMPE